MSTLIKEAAVGYANIEKVLREHTNNVNMVSYKQVLYLAEQEPGGVKGIQQVVDCIRKLREQGLVGKVKSSGSGVVVWWKRNVYQPKANVTEQQDLKHSPLKTEMTDNKDIPDIRVTKNKVIITTKQVRITVDF